MQNGDELISYPFGDPAALAAMHHRRFGSKRPAAVVAWTAELLTQAIARDDLQLEHLVRKTSPANEPYSVWLPATSADARDALRQGASFSVRLADPTRCSFENTDCTDGVVGNGHAHDDARVCEFHNNVEWAWMAIDNPVVMTKADALDWLRSLRGEAAERERLRDRFERRGSKERAEWAELLISLTPSDAAPDALFDVTPKAERGRWLVAPRDIAWPAFTATKWDTAEEKTAFATALIGFADAGFPRTKFTHRLYDRLQNMFDHIAHYTREGFYREWFASTESIVDWLDNMQRTRRTVTLLGDPTYTWSDVQRALVAAFDARGYREIYAERLRVEVEATERAELERLAEKLGVSLDGGDERTKPTATATPVAPTPSTATAATPRSRRSAADTSGDLMLPF